MTSDDSWVPAPKRKSGKIERHMSRPRLIKHFQALGVQSQSDRRYVRLEVDPEPEGPCLDVEPIYVPVADFIDRDTVVQRLVQSSEFVPFPRFVQQAMQSAAEVDQFQPCVLHEQPGWTANRFALRNGSSIMIKADELLPCPTPRPPILGLDVRHRLDGEAVFRAASWRAREAGTLDTFCDGLVPLLAHDDVMIFSLALGFVPPLLRWSSFQENFGFSLVGLGRAESNVAMQLASCVFGRPTIDGELDREDDLSSHLQYELELANDHLVLLPQLDRWFALLSPAQQLAGIRLIARALNHNGTDTAGFFPLTRLVMLTTSAKPVDEYCPDQKGAQTLLDGRILAIAAAPAATTDTAGKHSGDLTSRSASFKALSAHVIANHGAAGPLFVRSILKRGLSDEEGLRLELDQLVEEFVIAAGVDPSDDVGAESAAYFGLVDAAAQLAKQAGALPATLDTRRATLECFRLNRSQPQSRSFGSLLRELIARPDTIDLGTKGKPNPVSDAQRANAKAYVLHSPAKCIVLIRDEDKYLAVPQWNYLVDTQEFRRALCKSTESTSEGCGHKSRSKTHATLGKGRKKERVWRFEIDIPPAEPG